MNATKKESWERIRGRGWDRFLVVSVGRSALGFAIGFALVYCGLVLFGRKPEDPVWEIVLGWALISLIVGAIEGLRERGKNEREYGESSDGHEGR